MFLTRWCVREELLVKIGAGNLRAARKFSPMIFGGVPSHDVRLFVATFFGAEKVASCHTFVNYCAVASTWAVNVDNIGSICILCEKVSSKCEKADFLNSKNR